MITRNLSFLLVISFSFLASAESEYYSYECNYFNQPFYDDTLIVKINPITNQVIVKIDEIPYLAKGIASSKKIKHKEFMIVNLTSTKESGEYQLDTEPLIMDKELFTGGYHLKKGGKGGFIKFVGQGYSYEKFLCTVL